MALDSNTYDIAIVGAGAAGIGAAKTAKKLGLRYALVEASHRVGGRAYTEMIAPGVAFDLGCHWLHSASLNPFVEVADAYGFTYTKGTFTRTLHVDGQWATDQQDAEWKSFFDRCAEQIETVSGGQPDASVADATARDSKWTGLFDYFVSLGTSADADQVAVMDWLAYRDTREDWPLKEGYGTLIKRFAGDLEVELNSAVEGIDWRGPRVRLRTRRGEIEARAALITVSTGILGAGDIRFTPQLPVWKQEAIAALPLGCHNRICLRIDRDALGSDHPTGATLVADNETPVSLRIRPFDQDQVVALTGGRFASWLERAGTKASVEFAMENLKKVFGADIIKRVEGSTVTAWEGDLWVKGAYSAALPGQFHQRARLGDSVDDRLFFAGEATSSEFYCTAHGAYLTGIEVVQKVARLLGAPTSASD